jgi:CobQ-like glutamine amidotransferase family enzyme
VKGTALRDAAEAGAVVLAVCGGYQLIGHEYRRPTGRCWRVGLLDLRTVHSRSGARRLIGNIGSASRRRTRSSGLRTTAAARRWDRRRALWAR